MQPEALPVVVIAGRPNVGKSTLFNALTRTRDALVADQPGVTRDRIYGRAQIRGRDVLLVDTGGLDSDSDRINQRAQAQTRAALGEADVVLFLVDGREPPGGEDFEIAQRLRKLDVPVCLAVNKTDGIDPDQSIAEFAALGLQGMIPIAAAHRRGLENLAETLVDLLPAQEREVPAEGSAGDTLRLALIGRPNVGKSTLLNRLLGEERAVTANQPGTTRDPVRAALERDGRLFELVDTAGIRRRRSQHEAVESLSTLKALQAMERADVVCLLVDVSEGITEQDARLAGHVVDAGRGLVVVFNKWDTLNEKARNQILKDAADDLKFVSWAPVVILSALHGSGIRELIDAVRAVYESACRRLGSGALSRVLEKAVESHAPAVVQRFAPKLRYAHAGGNFPTRIIIHGNRTEHVQPAYRRYLVNRFREAFELVGVPIQLLFRDSENPFAGRKNKLTPRQIKRRQRVRKRKR
jgi:GTP-binding protein